MSFIPEARGGTSEVSRTVALATYRNDTVIVLHPDDLVHRQDNPLDWLHESFAYGAESAAGRILAFDGEYRGPVIRLTTQGLSERERTWAGGSWTFGYEVRHGKVFVGTAASLNYVDFQKSDARLRKLLPEDGFELSNGSYAVTVHPIEWESEPGALKPDGKRAADALAEYVIVFQPVDDLHKIETASTPIFLERRRSSTPARMKSFSLQSDYEQPTEEPGPQPFAVVSTPDVPVVTGFMQAVPDAEGVQATSRKLGIRGLVAAAEAREEALAVVVETRAYEGPDSGHPVVSLTLAGGAPRAYPHAAGAPRIEVGRGRAGEPAVIDRAGKRDCSVEAGGRSSGRAKSGIPSASPGDERSRVPGRVRAETANTCGKTRPLRGCARQTGRQVPCRIL